MKALNFTHAKGFDYQRIGFDWNPEGSYSVEDITITLVLEKKMSSGEAFKIEIMKNIEDQIQALLPFKEFFEPILRYGYK